MHISAIYIHPIKSLLPISLSATALTALGFPHDRTFLLIRTPENKGLYIGDLPQLCLFSVAFSSDSQDAITVTYTGGGDKLTIPLTPPLGEAVEVDVRNSSCTGYGVSAAADEFFTTHLGFPTRLLFLGDSSRKVLGNVAPEQPAAGMPSNWLGYDVGRQQEYAITFVDCAPLLVTTSASLEEVGKRVGGEVDMRRFRPNVVLTPNEGEKVAAWEEDYWGEIEITGDNGTTKIVCTANCARCTSLNVDFATGGYVESEKQPLKSMAKDRRVDPGMKYSPVFGRYAFMLGEGPTTLKVGDHACVTKRNAERTEFCE
ncbi:hypothetical protein FN846DRAFT_973567 [Sphaerosporella brunnea]|uniref:MOSC domain-containing protein n=1 Tax=Sphaerosporella brunnea TaxID=1250544 RepID=A0A5J5EHF7_9PEZI|nr:hypothetical protein FN846DRAFT_973567 [Sphaerosporella brunnea]